MQKKYIVMQFGNCAREKLLKKEKWCTECSLILRKKKRGNGFRIKDKEEM